MWLWRPILSEPPIYNMHDLKTWVTLTDVMDAHEVLDLKSAMAEKATVQ
jgi:hypothetical protein